MYQWENLYKEKLKPSEMSTRYIRSVIKKLEGKDKEKYSYHIVNLESELEYRATVKKTDRYLKVYDTISSGQELDRKFYKNYMNYIVRKPDLLQDLISKHKIPVDILTIYQSKIIWSAFFFYNKHKMTEEYLKDIIESIVMTDERWAMVVMILDLEEDFINSIFDFISPAFLIGKDLSFVFWKNNIHRLFVFEMAKNDIEYRKKKMVWEKFIDKYKNFITASLIHRCRYYIPEEVWDKISQEIELSDDYIISLVEYLNINKMIGSKPVSSRVLYECRNYINWKEVDYYQIDDKAIIKLKEYVDWESVFLTWSKDMYKQRTESDRDSYEKTGDILKHKNFVDWEEKLVEWGLYDRRQLSYLNITGTSRERKYMRDH